MDLQQRQSSAGVPCALITVSAGHDWKRVSGVGVKCYFQRVDPGYSVESASRDERVSGASSDSLALASWSDDEVGELRVTCPDFPLAVRGVSG